MGEDTTVFLSETRRKVLADDYDGNPNTERTHQSRIRAQSRTALKELIEVAESEAIENEDVFEPETVHHLLSAITMGGGGLDPYTPPEDYRNAVHSEMAGFFISYSERDRDADE